MRTMPKAPEGPYTTINGQPIYDSNNNNIIEASIVNDINNDFLHYSLRYHHLKLELTLFQKYIQFYGYN